MYNDFLSDPKNPAYESIPAEFASLDRKSTITNKDVEKAFAGLSKSVQAQKLEPTMDTVRRVGNMYTASLYGGLASLLSNVESASLQGKRILMYSFGSGSAASFFAIKVSGDVSNISKTLDLKARLDAMEVVPCQSYVDSLKLREATHNAVEYKPVGDKSKLWPGSYYLREVDSMYRRFYERTPKA